MDGQEIMMTVRGRDIQQLSIDEISQQLECSTTLLEGLQEKQSSLAYQINELKDDLKEKEAVSESQKSRLRHLKSFIESEQGGKEQLEATLSQNSAPPNIKEKLYNIKAQIKRCKQEEEKLLRAHFSTLETIRNLHSSIAGSIEDIVEFDHKVSIAKKEIAILKRGLNQIKAVD